MEKGYTAAGEYASQDGVVGGWEPKRAGLEKPTHSPRTRMCGAPGFSAPIICASV
jgi:hypothetical protein